MEDESTQEGAKFLNEKMDKSTIKPIMMVLALLALTPSGVVGETLQHDANTEADEVTYDLVRNIGAFSKVETINESVRLDYSLRSRYNQHPRETAWQTMFT